MELGRLDEPPFPALPVGGEPAPEPGVFQDLEIRLRGMAGYGAVVRDVREVDDLSVAQGGGVQEVRKVREVPDQALRGDLLLEVVGDAGVQEARRPQRLIHPRQVAVVEHPGEVEPVRQLVRGQAVQLVPDRSSPQRVRGPAPHLAGARTAEGKTKPAVLEQPVRLVEEGRNLLNLVDDDPAPGPRSLRFDLLAQAFGIGGVAPGLVGLQQIAPAVPRVPLPQSIGCSCRLDAAPTGRRFPLPARAERGFV